MSTEEKFIVAIELGSSKAVGIVGKRQPDGNLQVLAMTEEPASSFMLYGTVHNVEKTTQCIRKIVDKLQTSLQKAFSQVYVGLNGQGLHSVKKNIKRANPNGEGITRELVDEMRDANAVSVDNNMRILDNIPQEYKIGTQIVLDPVGILGDFIEGHYLNIVARPALLDNLTLCFEKAKVKVVDFAIAPIVLGENILTDAERRSGCVLVDLGAEITTVSIYNKNILRHLTVIPLGSHNVTKDIMSLQIEEEEAEKIKIEHGSAYTSFSTDDVEPHLADILLRDGRTLQGQTLAEIVEARIQEIIFNVKEQIRLSGYGKEQLLGGIIITGGGANMRNIQQAFATHTGFDKFRMAKEPQFGVTGKVNPENYKNGRYNTILSLINYGQENCNAGTLAEQDLFGNMQNEDEGKLATQPTDSNGQPRVGGNKLMMPTPDKAVVSDTEPQQTELPEVEENEEAKEKEPSKLSNFMSKAKRFFTSVVSDEEDEEK